MFSIRELKRHTSVWCCLFIFACVLVVLYACAPQNFTSKEKQVYTTAKTLEAAVTFRDTGLKVAADLWMRGVLSDKKKANIIKIGNEFKDVINVTKEALKDFNNTGDSGNLTEQLMLYHKIYGEFSDLVLPYLLKGQVKYHE